MWDFAPPTLSLRPSEAAALVSSDPVASALASENRATSETFYWLRCSLANAGTERRQAVLPEALCAELPSPTSATRVEQDGDALVAVINEGALDFHNDVADVSPVTLGVRDLHRHGANGLGGARLRAPLRALGRATPARP